MAGIVLQDLNKSDCIPTLLFPKINKKNITRFKSLFYTHFPELLSPKSNSDRHFFSVHRKAAEIVSGYAEIIR